MEPIEFTGKNTEEALQKAQERFGLSLDQLEVEVISAGSDGIFGLMGKKAVVRARPLGRSAAEEVAEALAFITEGPARAPQAKPATEPAAARSKPPAEPQAGPAARASRQPEPELPPREAPPTAAEGDEAAEAPPEEAAAKARLEEDPAVVAFAQQVLDRLVQALDGDAQVRAAGGEHGVELEIGGGEVGVLIGRRGQTLDALQYLTTRIVSHKWGRAVRVHVDAGGYRQRRRQYLEDTARRMADKARQTHKALSMGPLNSQERRVVHLVLRSQRGISTASRGRGELKKVVISPR